MIKSERIAGLDTLRGIGILVVVMVHAGLTGTAVNGALVFAVPLFYVVAGCLYRDMPSLKALLADKTRRLIIPFLFFALAGLTLYVAGNCVILHKSFNPHLFNILSTDRYYLPYPAALWFFMSIFWCYIFYGVLCRFAHTDAAKGIASLCIGAGGWILSRHAALPLSLDTAMSWLPFFYIGNMIANHSIGQQLLKGKYAFAGAIMTAACCALHIYAGLNTGYCYNLFVGSIPLIILLCLGATMGMLMVCCKIGELPVISYIGRNSLVIFACHQHFMIIMEQGMKQLNIANDGRIFNYIIFVVSIAASAGAAILLRKFAPRLIGERKKIRIDECTQLA